MAAKRKAAKKSKTKSKRKASARKAKKTGRKKSSRRWSKHVTETSDALDLKGGIFKSKNPKKIADSLKRSAEHSHRRKSSPYRSAISMLTFYMNRAGKNLPASHKKVLERAKTALKKDFGRA